jgi:hypothetical protein
MVVKGLQEIIMKLLFKEGDMTKGLTPLGDGLGKIFLALSAPAFINALIMGLVPMAIQGMGAMLLGTLTGLGPKIAAGSAASKAAKLATAQKAAAAAKNARFASMALGAAPVAAAAAPAGGTAVVGGLASIPVAGWVAALAAAVVVFEGPIMALTNTMQNIGKKMQQSDNWLKSSFGQIVQGIGQLFAGITQFFNGLWEIVSGLLSGDADRVVAGIKKLFTGIGNTIVGIGRMVGGLGGVVIGAIGNLFKTIAELLRRAANKVDFLNIIPDDKPTTPTPGPTKPTSNPGTSTSIIIPKKTTDLIKGADFSSFGQKPAKPTAKLANRYDGGLGDAVLKEMRMKPPGSDLVIANSSETIIPAAGGLGMGEFMATLNNGFNQVAALISQTSQQSQIRDSEQTKAFNTYKTSSDQKWNQNNDRLLALQQQLTKMAMTAGGSMLGIGGPGGNVISIGKQLLAMGLQVGENPFFQYGQGFLPNGGGRLGGHAQGSYHYQGRALDVSGPPGQLDQVYAMLKGTNPSELLWKVPGHFDHLHVAYALGAGNPAFFNSQEQALAWEKKASLGNVKLSSITSRQGEFNSGGDINITAPITINQQPGQDAEALASMVAIKLSEAINQARSASIFV